MAADPTAGFSTGQPTFDQGTMIPYLSPQALSQWQQYFAQPGATPQTQTVNQLVQTGTQFTPDMPWLQQMGLPVGALGLNFGGDAAANAQAAAASPYANNPYYSQILGALGQGQTTPTYTMQSQQVTTPAPVTPEMTALANLYGVPPDQLSALINQQVTTNQQYQQSYPFAFGSQPAMDSGQGG